MLSGGPFYVLYYHLSQLALAYPSEVGGFAASLVKFLGIFAATQVPLAVIEGILSVVIMIALESFANSELRELGYLKGGAQIMSKNAKIVLVLLLLCVVIAVVPMIFLGGTAEFGGADGRGRSRHYGN